MSSILKVDTIQNTGGTTGLTIDSSGRVLKPVIPFGQFGGPASETSGGNLNKISNSLDDAFYKPLADVLYPNVYRFEL